MGCGGLTAFRQQGAVHSQGARKGNRRGASKYKGFAEKERERRVRHVEAQCTRLNRCVKSVVDDGGIEISATGVW